MWLRLKSLIILQLTFSLTLGCDSTCDYCLSNWNFTKGTYRIMESGKYCLSEDIVFNPNPAPISDPNRYLAWYPNYNDPYYFNQSQNLGFGPYSLGFFACITIETDDVELDLYGYTIEQHPLFYLQQRFYSHIEIGNAPFLSGISSLNSYKFRPLHLIATHSIFLEKTKQTL